MNDNYLKYEKKVTLALCEGRHEMPDCVEGYIYPQTLNPLDVSGLEEQAFDILWNVGELDLYVTELTVALVAVINVCRRMGILLTLFHYNREEGKYYEQEVC